MDEATRQAGDRSDLLALQMDALYKAAPASVLSIAGAVLALVTYWSAPLLPQLLLWFGCVSGVAVFHIFSAFLRRQGRPEDWKPANWARLIQAIYLASGLSWGIGGAWMLGHGDEHW